MQQLWRLLKEKTSIPVDDITSRFHVRRFGPAGGFAHRSKKSRNLKVIFSSQSNFSIFNLYVFRPHLRPLLIRAKKHGESRITCHFYLGFFLFATLSKQKISSKIDFFLPGPLSRPDWAKLVIIFTSLKS